MNSLCAYFRAAEFLRRRADVRQAKALHRKEDGSDRVQECLVQAVVNFPRNQRDTVSRIPRTGSTRSSITTSASSGESGTGKAGAGGRSKPWPRRQRAGQGE